MFKFATRNLHLTITPDNAKGTSAIFIGADRHYPDGFTVKADKSFILTKKPTSTGFEIHSSHPNTTPSNFIWDEHKQRLLVLRWPDSSQQLDLVIQPGIYKDPDPLAKNNH